MHLSVARELKKSVGDQLRGVRYLVRMLGSDAQRPYLAPPALPDALPEIDRLLGKTFRAVDNVMSAVETTVRPSTASFRGFVPLEDYSRPHDDDVLQNDIYRGLKATVSIAQSNQLVLKARVAHVQADMAASRIVSDRREERCAEFLRALARRSPLVDIRGDTSSSIALKHYIALALLFGLADKDRPLEEDALSLLEDAFLLANTRLNVVTENLEPEKPGDTLVSTLGVLLDHLA